MESPDDLWNPLVPEYEFARIWANTYPKFLILNVEPRNENGSVDYLDMKIRHATYSKRTWGDGFQSCMTKQYL